MYENNEQIEISILSNLIKTVFVAATLHFWVCDGNENLHNYLECVICNFQWCKSGIYRSYHPDRPADWNISQ